MRVAEIEATPIQTKDARTLRELAEAASRASCSSYLEAFALYRILCHREPNEPRHAHRAAEMCLKLAETTFAQKYLRLALEKYTRKGLLPYAIAVAQLGAKLAPEDLLFQEKLGTFLTIRENEAWLLPTMAAAAAAANETPSPETADEAAARMQIDFADAAAE